MHDSTELFCKIDDFFQKFEPTYLNFIKQTKKIQRIRCSKLSLAEIIFINIQYKCSQFNNFKAFFYSIPPNDFKYLPNYQRVIHLINTHQLALHKEMKGKVYSDRGYISLSLKEDLKTKGVDLVNYHRKNMKLTQLDAIDKHYLKQRNKIETLFSLLKDRYHLVTSKARSIEGYLAGIYAPLCAYQLCHENKPMIRMSSTLA